MLSVQSEIIIKAHQNFLNLPTCIHQWQLHVSVSPLLVESWLSGRSAWPKEKNRMVDEKGKKRKNVSEVGFEPTPTYVDQKPRTRIASKEISLSLAP